MKKIFKFIATFLLSVICLVAAFAAIRIGLFFGLYFIVELLR